PARPSNGTSFREVSADVSRATLQQVMRIGGDVVANDKITALGGKGFVNRPTGPVQQIFGDQRNINTGGGDYAEGNIDKSDQFALTGNFQGAVGLC
ncbi:MAG: hypothetical protein ACJ8CR_09980, partial [Roseiflexaceae bacterium]